MRRGAAVTPGKHVLLHDATPISVMSLRPPFRRAWYGAALVLLAACSDDATLPTQAAPSLAQLACAVDVHAQTLSCASVNAWGHAGARGDRIIGGQDVYVKLSSSGTAYDGETQVLRSDVTLQNLAQQAMGTPDGTTVAGTRIFFASGPTVTAGTGTVSVANADGTDVFTASNQPYFLYGEILSPYQVSAARTWRFNVSPTVTTFTFTVYVSAPLADERIPLVDRMWTGAVSTDWADGRNWQGGVAPDSGSVVAIPPDSLLASPNFPALSGDAVVRHLRVGYASTLALNGHALRVRGNVDAVGAISGGPQTVSGDSALLRGNVGALQVTGHARLQGAVKTSGAVSVTGSLTVKDQALSIQVP